MKVLLASTEGLWTQGVAAELHALGHDVVGIYDYRRESRRKRPLGLSPVGRLRMQGRLVRLARDLAPDLLFVNKGEQLWGRTLRRISDAGVRTLDWYPDDPHRLAESMKLSTRYDYYFTHCSYAAERLRKEAGANAIYMPLSCIPIYTQELAFDEGDLEHYRADVCFIGTYDGTRERVLSALADLDLRIWGPDWAPSGLTRCWTGHGAYGLEARKALAGAKVVVNVHRNFGGPFEGYGHGANVRVFETTAAGAFLLCDRKKDVETMFEEGSEVAYYETIDEARHKVLYYLDHEDERRAAAARAQAKARREHSLRKRLADILAIVEGGSNG